MQVSLTATGGLERRLEVAIPAAQVDGEVAQRLTKISRTARLKGFRPGKAPIASSTATRCMARSSTTSCAHHSPKQSRARS